MPLPGVPWSHPSRGWTDAAVVVLLRSAERLPVPQGPVPRGLLRGARRRLVPTGPRPQSLLLRWARWEALLEVHRPGAMAVATKLLVIVAVVPKLNALTTSRRLWR